MRLNIQLKITYSTTDVEFNTTMALVVLIGRCNFVSAGTEKHQAISLYNLSRGSALILLKRTSWLRS